MRELMSDCGAAYNSNAEREKKIFLDLHAKSMILKLADV